MKNIIFNKTKSFVGRNTSDRACQIFCSKSNCETMYHWFRLEANDPGCGWILPLCKRNTLNRDIVEVLSRTCLPKYVFFKHKFLWGNGQIVTFIGITSNKNIKCWDQKHIVHSLMPMFKLFSNYDGGGWQELLVIILPPDHFQERRIEE
jgi:hypothetical protein